MTSAFTTSFILYAKAKGITYPTVKTVMLSGQVFSEKIRLDIIKYMGALPWVIFHNTILPIKVTK